MEFFKIKKDIPFMRHALVFNVISLVTFLLAVGFLATKGLNFGVDFTGGTVMEVSYGHSADIPKIRDSLTRLNLHDVSVQNFGTSRDVLIRLPLKAATADAKLSETVMQALRRDDATVELRRVEFVGPQVGEELRDQGGLGMLMALGGVLIYLAFRFQWKFAVGAIISLIHDVVVTMGILSFFQITFDLTVLAAVLAIIGYSLNDTIVVFDRVRENFRLLRKASLIENINISTTQTLLRTIATSVSTLLAIVALWAFGGDSLEGFSIALFIGVLAGTYSSIYIANVVLIWLNLTTEDLIPPVVVEKADDLP